MPFSYGPFSCVGKQVALQEMRLVLTAVVREFDAKLPDDFDSERFAKSTKSFFTIQIEELPMILTRRRSKAEA